MANHDDLDLIRLFGLSHEEANGLGLDAAGRPSADDADPEAVLPRHAEPAARQSEPLAEPQQPIRLVGSSVSRKSDALLADELALFAMLDSEETGATDAYNGHDAPRGLALAAHAEPLPGTHAEPPPDTRAESLSGAHAGLPPGVAAAQSPCDLDEPLSAPLGLEEPAAHDSAVADDEEDRFIIPTASDGDDDMDLVSLFGLSAEEASGLGLAGTPLHYEENRVDAPLSCESTGVGARGDAAAFPTMHLHAIGNNLDDEDPTAGFFIADESAGGLDLDGAAPWTVADEFSVEATHGPVADHLDAEDDHTANQLYTTAIEPDLDVYAESEADAIGAHLAAADISVVASADEPAPHVAASPANLSGDGEAWNDNALAALTLESDGWDTEPGAPPAAQPDDWHSEGVPTMAADPALAWAELMSGQATDDTNWPGEPAAPVSAEAWDGTPAHEWTGTVPRSWDGVPDEPPAAYSPQAIDPDLLDAFAEESTELLDALHLELERLEGDVDDHGALLETRRLVHTLKGGAKMCGFEIVAALAHSCENLLDLIADGAAALDAPALHALFDCEPLLRASVQDAIAGEATDTRGPNELAARFDALCASAQATSDAEAVTDTADDEAPASSIDLEPLAEAGESLPYFQLSSEEDAAVSAPDARQDVGIAEDAEPRSAAVLSIEEGVQLGAGAPVEAFDGAASRTPDAGRTEVAADREQHSPAAELWRPRPSTAASGPADASAPEQRPASRRGSNSISVDLGKVDAVVAKVTEMAAHRASSQGMIGHLMETTREAQRNVTRLHNLVMQLGNECAGRQPEPTKDDDLNLESYNALNTLIIQLQEAVSDQQALVQSVHDTLTSHWGLQASETRVDADIQSALMSIRLIPIANMRVRLDGVVRQAAEATGKQVRWQLQGGNVAVEKNVFDRLFEPLMHLLRNAIDHGIEAPAVRREAGKPESGAITVSASQEGNQIVIAVSDDGDGIVPNKIATLAVERGIVSAEQANGMSHQQKIGLIFTPGFSTADKISHISGRGVGMDAVRESCLRMGGSIDVTSRPGVGTTFTMRLPLSLSVTRGLIVRDGGCLMVLPVSQVVALHLVAADDVAETPRGRVARIEGQELPIYNLPPLPGAVPASYVQNGEINVLQVAHEGGSIGLLIEDVVGEEEVLIKAPPALLRGVKTLLGAYVLPDGRVAPVVNLPQMLIDLRAVTTLAAPREEGKATELRALVVDDSMSMRVALSGTLQSAGFNVLTARDGQEALDLLKREGLPSLVTLDVEMPRMDGLETLFAIRHMPGPHGLPVFMMTSRGGAKHRRAAEQLGATRYFTKPYRDSELASAAREVCADAISA